MKARQMLPMLIAGAAIGVLVFLLLKTQTVDGDLHLERLARIREVADLDVRLNRIVVESRIAFATHSTNDRTEVTKRLGDTLAALNEGPQSLRNLSSDLNDKLDIFLASIEDKFVLAFDFEARNTTINQRLVNSLDAVAIQVNTVQRAAPSGLQQELKPLLGTLQAEVVTYAVTPTPSNAPAVRAQLDQLDALAAGQGALREPVQVLRARCEEVLADKAELVERLNSYLARPTGPQLEAVENAYTTWHQNQVAVASQYRLWLVAYAAILLLSLALLGIRLNRSFRDLDRANDELSHANENLEAQVEKRTHDLKQALQDLRNSEAQLIQSEKMAGLGQMVAGVAHEINTPLGYARSNADIVRSSLGEMRELCLAQGKALDLMVSDQASDDEVAQALAEAKARGDAVNIGELSGDLDNLLADTDHGLSQIAELVSTLKDFSRVDRSRTGVFNVNEGLDAALKICHNQLKQRIEVLKTYGQLPPVECSPSQLNQVFLNLITNAAQAIEGEGKLFLHTTADPAGVCIRILDTGKGMSEDVRSRIFDPFFTTKPVGQGTGLGLTIVYRIIEDHGGHIEVKSAPGKGSEFIIRLPLKQKHRPEAEASNAESAAA